jgi:hypothetical protein
VSRVRALRLIPALCLTPGLIGCAGATRTADAIAPPRAAVDPDAAPALFDAAREALAEFRFTLDRVDAARGVITTMPKQTAGIGTPWDREQSALSQEIEDLAHQHERTVRVVFEPAGAPTEVRVEVVVHRVRRPNWRVETDAIRQSSHARDPLAIRSGQRPEFTDPVAEDRALAARILARIGAISGVPLTSP